MYLRALRYILKQYDFMNLPAVYNSPRTDLSSIMPYLRVKMYSVYLFVYMCQDDEYSIVFISRCL
jgi:hypothetical protein